MPTNTLPPATSTPVPTPVYQVLWSFQTQGAIWGTPFISEDTVYIGSDDGSLYAVHASSGNLKWKFTTQGLVRSRPAIAGGLLYFTSDDGYLYALETGNGRQAWQVDIGNFSQNEKRQNPGTSTDPRGFDYYQSSPIIVDGMIYVGSADGKVYALDALAGKINWTFTTGQKVRATPAFQDDTVYIGSWDSILYALDSQTGQARWKTNIGGQVQSTAVISNGLVYTASRKASVVSLDSRTGEKKWEYGYGANMWVESSPKLVGSIIYIGSSGNRYVIGLDGQTGKLLASYKGLVFFWSTPLIAGKNLYIGATTYIMDNKTGGLFSFEIPEKVDEKQPSPIKFAWSIPVAETMMPDGNWLGVASSPVLSDGIIYFGGLDGKLYAVNPGE